MKTPMIYLNFLRQAGFSLANNLQPIAEPVGKLREPIGKLRSMNSVYRRDLEKAQSDLFDYFNRSLHRPFNCLLLGPPGSGKAFIAKQLADFGADPKTPTPNEKGGLRPKPEDKPKVTRAKFLEYNLSQLHGPGDLTQIFQEIARAAEEPKIVHHRSSGSPVVQRSIQQSSREPHMFEGPRGRGEGGGVGRHRKQAAEETVSALRPAGIVHIGSIK